MPDINDHDQVTLDLTTEPSDDAPDGCLGCNHEDVVAFLKLRGLTERDFTKVERDSDEDPRHGAQDTLRCGRCGACWLQEEGTR